jgi:hypothetical protein
MGDFNLEGFDLSAAEALTGVILVITTALGTIAATVSRLRKKLRNSPVSLIAGALLKRAEQKSEEIPKHDSPLEPNADAPSAFAESAGAREETDEFHFHAADGYEAEVQPARRPESSGGGQRLGVQSFRAVTLRGRHGIICSVEYRTCGQRRKRQPPREIKR